VSHGKPPEELFFSDSLRLQCATYIIQSFVVHYTHVGHAQTTSGPFTPQVLPTGQSELAQVHDSGLSPPHGLSAHEYVAPIAPDRCTQTCPGTHMNEPQGTTAHAEVLTLQTSLMQVASALLVPNAHS
jgi:hypothetical protein